MRLLRLAVCIPLLATSFALQASNWDRWRGPDNSGVAAGEAPVTWSDSENVKWVAEVPGLAHSTPIVWGDRVFLTTAVSAEAPAEPGQAQRRQQNQGRRQPAMTPEMRERIRELSGGRELSDLSREERQQIMRQVRRGQAGQGRGGAGRAGAATAPQIVEHTFLVIALDRTTGEKVWERKATVATPHEGHHRRYGSFASSSPVTDGEMLYAFFGSRGLYAYDMDGEIAWTRDFGVNMRMTNAFGEGSSPALHGGTLLLVFDHEGDSFITALDKRTGKELWRRDRGERSAWAQPLIVEHNGRAQAIVAASSKIRSYDLASGEVVWECAGLGSNVIPAVVRDGDVIYAMSGHREPNLLAIKLGGSGDITGTDHVLWTNQRGNSYSASPVISDGILYFVTDRGMISALDAATGEPHYQQQRLPNPYSLKASPLAAAGRLYIATEQGDVAVVAMGTEYEVLAVNTIKDEFFVASPVVVDGGILLRGRSRLYAIGD